VTRFAVDLTPYPAIAEVMNNLKDIPAFVAASPANQIDNPDYVPKEQKWKKEEKRNE